MEAQKTLIHSLRAHIDDCYAVLSCLKDPTTVPSKADRILFTDKWLEAVNFPALHKFTEALSFYRNAYLGPLVNGLKHRQARLRGLVFHKWWDIRLGYYLEEPGTDGIPGPSPNVHRDRNSAFSFAKDIVLNIYHVYFISDCLTQTVKLALLKLHSFVLEPKKTDARSKIWTDIFLQAAAIRPLVFPDEIDKAIASLTYVDKEAHLSLRYPVLIFSPQFPQGMKIKGTIHLDGVGLTYKLPYLQASQYGHVR